VALPPGGADSAGGSDSPGGAEGPEPGVARKAAEAEACAVRGGNCRDVGGPALQGNPDTGKTEIAAVAFERVPTTEARMSADTQTSSLSSNNGDPPNSSVAAHEEETPRKCISRNTGESFAWEVRTIASDGVNRPVVSHEAEWLRPKVARYRSESLMGRVSLNVGVGAGRADAAPVRPCTAEALLPL
jgi:hypothetical protein